MPPPPPIFLRISYLYSNQDGQIMPTKLMPPPPDFWTFRCLWSGTWPKKKKAVGCLSSKKYSNHNYTHTLESSCLCQVAEINVALRGERAARACKGAKEFLTRANDKSCLLENMKHIGLFMLVSFIAKMLILWQNRRNLIFLWRSIWKFASARRLDQLRMCI